MNSTSNCYLDGIFGQLPDRFGFLICVFSSQCTSLQALPSDLQGSISLRCFAHGFAFHLMAYGSLIILRQNVPIYMQCTLEVLPVRISPQFFYSLITAKNHDLF